MLRGSVIALVVLSAIRADARPVRLDVQTDACPDIAASLGTGFDPTAKASVEITEHARTATLLFSDGDGGTLGPRTVEAATCAELATAVATIVAMTLPAIADRPDPVAPPPTSIEHDPETPVIERRIDPAPTGHRITFDGAVSRSSALGNVFGFGARWGSARVTLGAELAAAWLPEIAVSPAARVDVTRFAAAVVPCAHHGAFGLCGVVRAGFDRGSGVGLADARTVELPVVELGGRVVWEQPVSTAFALQLRGELTGALTSSALTVDQMAVWHSSRYAALAGAAVLVRFP